MAGGHTDPLPTLAFLGQMISFLLLMKNELNFALAISSKNEQLSMSFTIKLWRFSSLWFQYSSSKSTK